MVRWMCGVSLRDRKRSSELYSLMDIQPVADVVKHDILSVDLMPGINSEQR